MSKIFIEEHLPAQELRDYIKSFWIGDSGNDSVDICNKFPPAGCIDIIFQETPSIYYVNANAEMLLQLPRFFSYMQLSKSIDIRFRGQVKFYGVRLQPFAGKSVLGMPISNVNNAILDLQKLPLSFSVLGRTLVKTGSNVQAIEIMNSFFMHLKESFLPLDDMVRQMCSTLLRDHTFPIEQLYKMYKCGKQVPRTSFYEHVGLLPKQFANIVQVEKTLSTMATQAGKNCNLTSLAVTTHYFDQSHFIKKFKSVMNTSPKSYFSSVNPINSYLNSFSSISSLCYSASGDEPDVDFLP